MIDNEQNEVELQFLSEEAGWSHTFQDQNDWNAQIAAALEPVASYDPRVQGSETIQVPKSVYCNKTKKWYQVCSQSVFSSRTTPPPSSVSAMDAAVWSRGQQGVDMRPHLFNAQLGGHLLLDSGSSVSAWPPEPGDKIDPKTQLKAVNGSRLKCYGFKTVDIKIGRKTYSHQVVIADVSSPVIGWDFVRKYKLDMVWGDDEEIYIFDKKAKIKKKLEFKPISFEQSVSLSSLSLVCQDDSVSPALKSHQLVQEIAAIESIDDLFESTDLSESKEDINIIKEEAYRNLLAKFPNLLERKFNEDQATTVTHNINTGNAKPVRAKTRRLLPGSEKAVKGLKAWQELVKFGIVEKVKPSQTYCWSSPLHLVPKPNGELRPVGDFRLLNQVTDLDVFPIPHLKDFVQEIAGSRIFSKCDLYKAFHQIALDKESQIKTATVTPWGMYIFKRLAMGMQNSAQTFQRYISDVIGDVPNTYVYLDDILIFSKNEEDHLKTLELLFTKLSKAGLAINLSKCEFGRERLDYLGYTVDSTGIKPIQKKVAGIVNFPEPVKQKQLQAFLGALNYYRSSLPPLVDSGGRSRTPAEVLDALYKLATADLKKGSFTSIWGSNKNIQQAFSDAKLLLTKAATLTYPDPSAPLVLSTDASKWSLGASLDQLEPDGSFKPLGFWSKALNPQQQLYTTFRRELLAMKLGLRHFINEVQGRRLSIVTDHRPLLGSFASPESQLHDPVALNAITEISQITTDIQYKPGKDLLMPDLLSRPSAPFNGESMPESGSSSSSPVSSQSIQTGSASPQYVQPLDTIAALQGLSLTELSLPELAKAQQACPDVKQHRLGRLPKNVCMADVDIAGSSLYCEISDPTKPRPLVPVQKRNIIVNLIHHLDHPGIKESTRRVAADYYWPALRQDVKQFCRTCHACQAGKQGQTVDPGVGKIKVPDDRFTYVHLDVVGPLPESYGYKYLLTTFCRTSRWLECWPMKTASSEECALGFLQWVSRYGLPSTAVSDNGNSFVANLYQDILKTFNIKVMFTPAYKAAANGAIERQHQNLKNSLRAALIQMGEVHKDQWLRALPWTLLGRRVAFQPQLDASSAQMVYGKSIQIPGQILSQPSDPLTKTQTKSLLGELYRLADRPAIPMSGEHVEKDISFTNLVTHVYVSNPDDKSLSRKFEGPWEIISRPSRSRVEVQIGVYANGEPRLQTYSWSSCKIAKFRGLPFVIYRPSLGRPTNASGTDIPRNQNTQNSAGNFKPPTTANASINDEQANQNSFVATNWSDMPGPPSSSESPVIPPEMFNGWPSEVSFPTRPVRSSRNPSPNYVSALAA